MENGTFAPHNILENLTFQRRTKALVLSKGWNGPFKLIRNHMKLKV